MNQYSNRRKQLLEQMKPESVFLLSSGQLKHKNADEFFPFQVNKNFYYLTGIREENLVLMMVKGKETVKNYLFIQETTPYMRLWVGEKTNKEEASKLSGIPVGDIFYTSYFEQCFYGMMVDSPRVPVEVPSTLYLDTFRVSKDVSPESFTQFKLLIDEYKELNVESLSTEIYRLRLYKSEEEIAKLKEAIEITKRGLNRVMDSVKLRTNEHQVEADFDHEIALNYAEGTGFSTIMASGKNACTLHYEDNDSPLNDGDLLLCDLGALKEEYSADISRTYPINGVFTERQKEIYRVVLDCNKKCIEFSQVGKTLREVHQYSVQVLAKGAMEIGLIEKEEEITKYYTHSIGHYLGLDVHDVGISDVKLSEGMVITIEPGLYIKEEGIGVRIEDDILITNDGPVNLSKDIVKEIKDIEEYMAK